MKNRKIVLKKRPQGAELTECWELQEEENDQNLRKGEYIVKVSHISIDPAMRGWINNVESYIPPVQLGETMRALGIAEVIDSRNSEFQVGDTVSGMFGVQQYCKLDDSPGIDKVDRSLVPNAPLTTFLGALGMPGMTAYFGLTDVATIQPSDTILISGAAGAVGAIAGQVAKLHGCHVVGIAGGRKKCSYLTDEVGFDAAIDYKSTDNLAADIASACPDGVDVFFDNVGGKALDASLQYINYGARIVICGAISSYNARADEIVASINYIPILFKSARLEGFVVLDYYSRYPEGIAKMAEWIRSGDVIPKEDVRHGIENFGEYFELLFSGGNHGKLVLEV